MAIAQLSLEATGILSLWLETLLYGLYTSLFFETVFIMIKKTRTWTRPSKIFFWAIIVMFISATAHIAINLYRILRAYVWLVDEVGPAAYLGNMERWDTITHDALNAFTTWIGDCLVIYRCYIVWDNNLPIVAMPIALVIMSIIANSIALHQFSRLGLGTIFSPSLVHWMDTIYAIAFVQNTMTTGLIAYRIWHQGAKSQGLVSSKLSLIPLVRIIVESAAIYVLNVLILIILYALNSNGQFVAQEAIVPVCGIVFTMITVRLALHTSPSLMTTELPATRIKFAGFSSTNANTESAGFSTTTDQSASVDSSKRPVHIDGRAFRDNSSDDIALKDALKDEKVYIERDTLPTLTV